MNQINNSERFGISNSLIFHLLEISVPLFIGFIIYILYRSQSIVLNDFLITHGFENFIAQLKSKSPSNMTYGIIYSLPNALWLSSLQLITLHIWNLNKSKSFQLIWSLAIIMITVEIFQKIGIVNGTFCQMDIICIIGSSTTVTFLTNIKVYQTKYTFDLYQKILLTCLTISSFSIFAMWTGDV